MEISFDRSRMLKAVNTVKSFADSAGLKVLQSTLISAGQDHVRLTTSDLTLSCRVELDARTPRPGTVLVPVRTLGTVLKTLSHSRVSFRKEGDGVCLAAGSSKVRITGVDPDEYPEITPPQERLAAVPLNASLVGKVAYAVSNDETRYTLGGVCTEVGSAGLKMVATDGHRLARYAAPSLPPGSVLDADPEEAVTGIVPARLLAAGVRLGSQLGSTAVLELYEKRASIQVNGSVTIWADLIDGPYPEYERTIPADYSGCVTMRKSVLGAAVSRLLALSKGTRVGRVRLAVEDGEMVLQVEDAANGVSATECLMPSNMEGTVPVCVFNVRYLAEALERLPDASWVHLKFSDEKGESPVAIESPECSGLLALIMPTRV